jgi:hypothetical protein
MSGLKVSNMAGESTFVPIGPTPARQSLLVYQDQQCLHRIHSRLFRGVYSQDDDDGSLLGKE